MLLRSLERETALMKLAACIFKVCKDLRERWVVKRE